MTPWITTYRYCFSWYNIVDIYFWIRVSKNFFKPPCTIILATKRGLQDKLYVLRLGYVRLFYLLKYSGSPAWGIGGKKFQHVICSLYWYIFCYVENLSLSVLLWILEDGVESALFTMLFLDLFEVWGPLKLFSYAKVSPNKNKCNFFLGKHYGANVMSLLVLYPRKTQIRNAIL